MEVFTVFQDTDDITCTSSTTSSTNETSHISERDYESVILMRMRQAQERKRLIEQLKAEDE